MARLLAIDYGGKRTGLAVTDPSKIIVSPLQSIETTYLTPFLKEYLTKENVERIIVGYPVNPMEDRQNPIVKQIILFTDNLKRLFPNIPLEFYNEEFSSVEAVGLLREGNFKKKYRQTKGNTDKMAAAVILQGWMDENFKN